MMGWDPFLPSSYVRHVLNAKTAWTAHSTEHATLKIYSGVCVWGGGGEVGGYGHTIRITLINSHGIEST